MSLKEVARYIGLVMLSILLILSLNSIIISQSANPYLYPQIYQQSLSKTNGYSAITEKIANDPMTKFIPKEMIEQQINKLIENVLSYSRSEKEQLDLTISLDNIQLKKSLEQKIADTPICANNQPPIPGEVPSCRMAGIANDVLLSNLISSKGISLDKPLTIDLKPHLDKDNKLSSLKEFVSTFQIIKYLSWIVLFISLIIIMFIAPSNGARMRWIGLPFLLVGISCFILQGVLGAAITDKLSDPEFSAGIQSIASDLAFPFKSNIMFYGIISGILGLILFSASFFFRKTQDNNSK